MNETKLPENSEPPISWIEKQKLDFEKQRIEIEKLKLELETQKVKIETEKLKILTFEERKLKYERYKTWIGIVPFIAAILTIAYGVFNQRQQENAQFKLKAAEIMFNSQDEHIAKTKADIMAAIFPEKLKGFAQEFEADSLGTVSMELQNFKLELLKMLNARTKNNAEAIGLWKAAFPNSHWADSLQVMK